MTALAVAAPQWRISTDRGDAARAALAAGADELHLDFGGAHRGPLLSDPAELSAAVAFAGDIPVPVLAVNHVNDIGLAHPWGAVNPAALTLVERALESALHLGARVLHVPGFRRSLPTTEGMRAGTVEALRILCQHACAAQLTLAYESPLGPRASLALARAVDRPELRLVLDTGNLVDAGEVPLEFAESVGAAGLLLPDLHVKDPVKGPVKGPTRAADADGAAPGLVLDELRVLLRRTGARSVLVENDYRCAGARLRTDITLCRAAAELSPHEDER